MGKMLVMSPVILLLALVYPLGAIVLIGVLALDWMGVD